MPTKKPASEESRCDAMVKQVGGLVVQFGRKGLRTKNTQGIPDRLYFIQGKMIYFEVKSANDYLSEAQVTFLINVLAYNGIAGCGNRDDLAVLLNAPNRFQVGTTQITKYSTRQKALRGA